LKRRRFGFAQRPAFRLRSTTGVSASLNDRRFKYLIYFCAMRTLLQRVSAASVTIDGQIHGNIQQGLLILLGIEAEDTAADIDWLIRKIVAMRIFSDAEGLMNLSVQDIGGDLLIVSQFTLHASVKKGNRPSFIRAARPDTAIPLYELFIQKATEAMGKPVATGKFGADMKVSLLNDGPVTIWMDSKQAE
jgi:D-tyrosyl-tRNA(Tyr) deacylase